MEKGRRLQCVKDGSTYLLYPSSHRVVATGGGSGETRSAPLRPLYLCSSGLGDAQPLALGRSSSRRFPILGYQRPHGPGPSRIKTHSRVEQNHTSPSPAPVGALQPSKHCHQTSDQTRPLRKYFRPQAQRSGSTRRGIARDSQLRLLNTLTRRATDGGWVQLSPHTALAYAVTSATCRSFML